VSEWETVIGLEVHSELATKTKLFCGCRNAFGDEPNVNICPTCIGLPGALPVLNEQAVELAMRIGAALHCDIRPSEFARKNYFYPDQAKDYQISQYDLPLNAEGWLDLPDGFRVGVTRAHMEEDTGKLTHVGASGRINAAEHALVDYNRSGVPLVEIVSEPDMRTSAQARAYASELRGILIATGASDGRMEEGSMRVDANVSVRPVGSHEFGTRCEIKNLNSFSSLGRAIDYEVGRQIALLESGGVVDQETRHWDESAGRTEALRSKEEANDYRYFPEPDLVPLLVTEKLWEAARNAMPTELPIERAARFERELGLNADRARELAFNAERGDYFERALAAVHGDGVDAVELSNWIPQVVERIGDLSPAESKVSPESLAALVGMVKASEVSRDAGREVLSLLVQEGGDPRAIVAREGLGAISATEDGLGELIDQAIAADPTAAEQVRAGNMRAIGPLVGYVMRETKGRADGGEVTRLIRERLG